LVVGVNCCLLEQILAAHPKTFLDRWPRRRRRKAKGERGTRGWRKRRSVFSLIVQKKKKKNVSLSDLAKSQK
jgi:hypothetical protein